ncbi:hypothetical protein ALC60_02583 [Trachymyrmex zeteki]|uniref:Uncharacterized protein n=1 Tax=Mycetomoellerius zeteki TaxID=64791 RepID=A0A151XDH9_9HYME|nr:hypothetical protein ALC60_02583 [Trachymyrmex zeteki]
MSVNSDKKCYSDRRVVIRKIVEYMADTLTLEKSVQVLKLMDETYPTIRAQLNLKKKNEI